jgi:tetratricopeptide (TPR) repeat protein
VLLARYENDPGQDTLAYVIGRKMGELFKLKGDPLPEIDAVFERLEASARDRDAVRLLRAELYLRPNDPVIAEKDRPALIERSRAALAALAEGATGHYQRKALATLARLHFGERDYARARELYDRFAASFPDSPYAWVAALRSAQSIEASDSAAAIPRFIAAADRFRDNPLAHVLGRAYAARAAEAVGRYDEALKHYRDAQSKWDADYGQRYSLYATRPATPGDPFMRVDDAAVERDVVAMRIGELTQTTRHVDGALVERARWLLAHGRWDEVQPVIRQFLGRHQSSALTADARLIAHTASLQSALALVDAEKSDTGVNAAIAALRALAKEPPDFAVVAGKIALATIAFLSGSGGDPDALMTDAVQAWRSLDASRRPATGALVRDVVEIRSVVFRPEGGGVYSTGRWNAFEWETGVQFYTVDP